MIGLSLSPKCASYVGKSVGLTTLLALGLTTASTARGGIIVTPTTNPTTLASSLGGTGLTINSVNALTGDPGQFGIYWNFSLMRDGVVLSSGNVVDTMGPPSASDSPATDLGMPGTPEFDAYGSSTGSGGATRIANFQASYDVATLQVNFTLQAPSAVSFSFLFGSIEYPNWVSNFTDSLLVFLDGKDPSTQITFDKNHIPVQVGQSFSNAIVTSNSETAFGYPHGFIPPLVTTTSLLSAGSHTLLFEVGDVNDHILDSSVFLTNFRVGTPRNLRGEAETDFEFEGSVPEPASIVLLGLGAVGLIGYTAGKRRGRI